MNEICFPGLDCLVSCYNEPAEVVDVVGGNQASFKESKLLKNVENESNTKVTPLNCVDICVSPRLRKVSTHEESVSIKNWTKP